NTQSYNRYGYAFNNPLMYVDPSGELFLEIGALMFFVYSAFIASAVLGIHALITNLSNNSASQSLNQTIAPTPGAYQGSSGISSSISRASNGDGTMNFNSNSDGGWFSNYWNGVKDGYGQFYRDIKNTVVTQYDKIVDDPWGTWKEGMREGLRDTSKNLIPGYAAYNFLLKPHVNS